MNLKLILILFGIICVVLVLFNISNPTEIESDILKEAKIAIKIETKPDSLIIQEAIEAIEAKKQSSSKESSSKESEASLSESDTRIIQTEPNKPLTVIVPEMLSDFIINYTTHDNIGDPVSTGFLRTGENTITGIYDYIIINIYNSDNTILVSYDVNYPSSSSKTLEIVNDVVTIPPFTTITITNDIPDQILI
jgi:hypothetical protein